VDELDSALVAALQDDGRRSNRDLAAGAGVAPSTGLERTRALRTRGVITGYHATVDLGALDRPVQAMIFIRLRPQSRKVMHGFRDFVAALPETLNVYIHHRLRGHARPRRGADPAGAAGLRPRLAHQASGGRRRAHCRGVRARPQPRHSALQQMPGRTRL